ncbi:unnamed protein product, partial [Meganyctiphanes norvegica]
FHCLRFVPLSPAEVFKNTMESQIAPGNAERAWNDPPQLAFNASPNPIGGGPANRKRLMNKRVPVPIGQPNASLSGQTTLLPGSIPPICGIVGSPQPPRPLLSGPPPTGFPPTGYIPCGPSPTTMPVISTMPVLDSSMDSKTPQEMLLIVEDSLGTALATIEDKMKENISEDVKRRLQTLRSMWTEGKLNADIQRRMAHLAKALTAGSYDDAWAMHQGLIVDYTGACSPWMIGVKTIIAETRIHNSIKENAGSGHNETTKEDGTEDLNSVRMLDTEKSIHS